MGWVDFVAAARRNEPSLGRGDRGVDSHSALRAQQFEVERGLESRSSEAISSDRAAGRSAGRLIAR